MKKKVVSHRDLEVYARAFDAALQLFELSKTFPKEETYSRRIRSGDLPGRFVRTLRKVGGNGAMRGPSSASFPMRRPKLLKRKYGLNSR